MSSMVDLSTVVTIIGAVATVVVAATLTVLAVLAPRRQVRARAERLLVLLFGPHNGRDRH